MKININSNNLPKIHYAETKTEKTGLLSFIGIGKDEEVTREKDMTVSDYVKETSNALAGNSNEVKREYDQQSINDALWAAADQNQDGYVDNDEYNSLVASVVTGDTSESSDSNPVKEFLTAPVLTGSLGLSGTLIHLSSNDSGGQEQTLTLSQVQSYETIVNADQNIDTNGDGKLNRDEFDQSAVNYILTEPDRLEE